MYRQSCIWRIEGHGYPRALEIKHYDGTGKGNSLLDAAITEEKKMCGQTLVPLAQILEEQNLTTRGCFIVVVYFTFVLFLNAKWMLSCCPLSEPGERT